MREHAVSLTCAWLCSMQMNFCTSTRKLKTLLTVLFCLSVSLMGADKRKPNIIFIFIDDQGYYDLGCYGATEIKTPRD